MPIALTRITDATVEPITVAEVRGRARINAGNLEPAPEVVTATLAGAGAGNVDNGAHRYACSFVTVDGETNGGTVSAPLTVTDKTVDGKVSLSAIPIGGGAVTARKLYRTAAGGSTYMLLSTIADNTATTYADNSADTSLGAGMPSTNTTSDPEVNLFIRSARMMAEKLTQRALCTQTWELQLDDFPSVYNSQLRGRRWQDCEEYSEIRLPRPPLVSVTSITYVDTTGATQTVDPSTYVVDTASEPARVRPVYGTYWPACRRGMGAVRVRYMAGYGAAAAVPVDIKDWLLLRVATAWKNRAQFEIDTRITMVELPEEFADGLLDNYIVHTRLFGSDFGAPMDDIGPIAGGNYLR